MKPKPGSSFALLATFAVNPLQIRSFTAKHAKRAEREGLGFVCFVPFVVQIRDGPRGRIDGHWDPHSVSRHPRVTP